jgi:very-short-patch-repair endonuclease
MNSEIYNSREIFFNGADWKIKRGDKILEKSFLSIEEAKKFIDRKIERTKLAWETKRKNGTGTAWNKGLNIDDERVKKMADKRKRTLDEKGFDFVPWNKGLTKESNEILRKISEDRKGENNPMSSSSDFWKDENKIEQYRNKLSNSMIGKNSGTLEEKHGIERAIEIKQKQSKSATERDFHGNTGNSHSEESKALMREATSRRISEGKFGKTNTIPMKIFEDLLNELEYKNIQKEHFIKYYTVDFADVKNKIAFEIDGDFWHSNPRVYPNGPIYKSQKKVTNNDKTKQKFLTNLEWTVIRFWEYDLKNNIDLVKNKMIEIMKGLK